MGIIALNETYWAPFDAHDPVYVQDLMLGLTLTPAHKVNLGLAHNVKLCKMLADKSKMYDLFAKESFRGRLE